MEMDMNKVFLNGIAAFFILIFCLTANAAAGDKPASGEELFKKNCQVCHPDGGNIINKEKPINRKTLQANGFKTPGDIVKQMRNPGPAMTKFTEQDIPDAEAEAIAKYIFKTFR